MGDEWLSASDIEKYGYCPLSWWLNREEEEVVTESLKEGTEEHREMGEKVGEVKEKEEHSKLLSTIIMWLAVGATLVSIMGLTFLQSQQYMSWIIRVTALIWLLAAVFFLLLSEWKVPEKRRMTYEKLIVGFAMVATVLALYSLTLPLADNTLARLAQIISLSLLIGANYWFKQSIGLTQEAKKRREELDIGDDEIEYVDRLKEKSRMLKSEEYRLRGRPDYILKVDERKIPVEVKTGRVPKGPFFSHVVQSAAYCLLLEEEEGEMPPYGIVKYGDKEFEVDYDESLRDLLINKIDEMREAIEKGEAHRHHHREGKCRNCSRREICPESLV